MCAADVHLPAVHVKHPQPEVRLAAQFLGGEGPRTTLGTERSGQVFGEGSGLDFARGAGYVDRLLVGAWGRGGVEDHRAKPVVPLQVVCGTESPCSQACQAGSSRRT